MKKFISFFREITESLWGAVAFYTIFPLPSHWSLQLGQIARFAPLIGILIGCFLVLGDWLLGACHVPNLTRSAILVASNIALTGGLHLDGVIDTTDGLAVFDPQRRLTVMKESTVGAFGVMAAVIIILLKVCALSEINQYRWLILMTSLGWGRWGQVCAIAFYPYLRSEGKGSFHKESFQFPQDLLSGWMIVGLISTIGFLYLDLGVFSVIPLIFGTGIPLLVAWWFNRQLGGHTGDSYGAVVEWSEAIYLCALTTLSF